MRVVSVTLRDFRTYERATAPLGGGLTVMHGPNGAGKTNLLEALYFGCTGRSCRTSNDRELVRFGADTARVELEAESETGRHRFSVGFTPGEAKRMRADGADVERLLDVAERPLVSVFLPDRLELVKGVPALRRAHLDQLVTALWPARAATRRRYAAALAQRNALLGRVKAGYGSASSLDTWDAELANSALGLMADRREAVDLVAQPFADAAASLGLGGWPEIAYRPRAKASDAAAFVAELGERRESDLERGFTGHGPHRDDLQIQREGRELRTYGSQGQQRLGLLALLLAERTVIAQQRGDAPLLLLDDVMSELDAQRRAALIDLVGSGGGQTVITTTDIDHVPGGEDPGVQRLAVSSGEVAADEIREGATP